jgi:hypothetical protein
MEEDSQLGTSDMTFSTRGRERKKPSKVFSECHVRLGDGNEGFIYSFVNKRQRTLLQSTAPSHKMDLCHALCLQPTAHEQAQRSKATSDHHRAGTPAFDRLIGRRPNYNLPHVPRLWHLSQGSTYGVERMSHKGQGP